MRLLMFLIVVICPCLAQAQGTAANYEFASKLVREQRTLRRVLNGRLEPHWTADGQHFWYATSETSENQTEDQKAYWLVDCQQGDRKPLLEQSLFEEALISLELKTEDQWNRIQNLQLSDDALELSFRTETHQFQWDVQQQKILKTDPVVETEKSEEKTSQNDRSGNRRTGRSPGPWRVEVRDHNLWLIPQSAEENEQADEPVQLTTDGTAKAPYQRRVHWSADGKWLAAIQRHLKPKRKIHFVESSPKEQLQPKLHTLDYVKPGDELEQEQPHLFQLETREELPFDTQLLENHWSVDRYQFSRDSSKFRMIVNKRGHQQLLVLQVDLATGQMQTLVNEQSETFLDYAYKQYHHFSDEQKLLIWMSERSGWNHLYAIDTESGEVKHPITQGNWVVREVVSANDETQELLLCVAGIDEEQDPYFKHYAKVKYDGTDFTRLTDSDGTHQLKWSPDRRYYIDQWSRIDHPPHFELREGKTGKLLTHLHTATIVQHASLPNYHDPQPFVAKGRDGSTDIYGIIHRPTNFDPTKKYPVIEKIYAGPHGSFVPKSFRAVHWVAELTELGFIVVQIDGMGTSNRSKAFHDVCWKNLGDAGFPDRMLWMKAAAEFEPAMDLSRVGIYGGSAGGQSTVRALLAHGDFYQVGVADCGCHDNRMDKIWWNELWMGWPIGPHYEEQSNVTQAHRLTGKLLLTVGELDRNVDPASTMQVVDALIKADKDFELLVFPGAGHGAGESSYGRRKRQDFFVRHLLDVEPRN